MIDRDRQVARQRDRDTAPPSRDPGVGRGSGTPLERSGGDGSVSGQLIDLQRLAGNRAVATALAGHQAGIQRAPVDDQPRPGPAAQPGAMATEDKPAPKVTGYIGMNPDAGKEVKTLTATSRETVLATTGNADLEKRLREEPEITNFVFDDLGISPAKVNRWQKAIDALVACDPDARDTLGELMRWMNRAENGEIVLDRLVLSGHSEGFEFWGDSHRGAKQQPGKLILERDFENVTAAFPGAAGQVRSIMFSACETVGAVQTVIDLFPGVDSVWSYAGFSPDIGSGSAKHIETWTKATEGEGAPGKKDARGEMALWTRKDGWLVNDPGSVAIEKLYPDAMAMYSTIAEPVLSGEAEIFGSDLNGLYGKLGAVVHHPNATDDQKSLARERMQVELRLRHWFTITEKFASTYGPELEPAYRELELRPPSWNGMSRKVLLAHLAELARAYATHPAASLARNTIDRLVRRGLVGLDPEVIPTSWN
jgi:hypothetical protein